MQINLRSPLLIRFAMVIEIAAFAAVLVWLTRTYLAEMVAQKPVTQNLRLATKLDPGNSDYHLQLARLLRYSLTDADPAAALEHLRRATQLNPRSPEPWLDLAGALDSEGRSTEAFTCLRHADMLAPNHPGYQWAIGNAFLLHGDIDEAFQHFKMVLAGGSEYDQILFSTAWKASGEANKILNELIPDKVETEFSYIRYLLSDKRYLEAKHVWQRLAAKSTSFLPMKAYEYLEALISAHRLDEAVSAWTDLRNKGIIKATYEATDQNLIINGDFEDGILNMGFDWRIVPIEHVNVEVDETTYRSPGRSFFIEFSGKQNVDYRNLFQYVRVSPGRSYRLHGYMKTEGITTDSGPRLEVRDAYNPDVLDKFSEDVRGSSTGWLPMTLEFDAPRQTDLLLVGVVRKHSQKFDSLIAGKVWVDDLSLTLNQE